VAAAEVVEAAALEPEAAAELVSAAVVSAADKRSLALGRSTMANVRVVTLWARPSSGATR
jgi:hypothetical protein